MINGIYYEKSLIGQGAFGQIYLGENTQTKELVAIKKEKPTRRIRNSSMKRRYTNV